jgi:hypothetical protein
MTAGSVLAGPRATARDLAVLAWIGEQYAVRMDLLRVLLGRYRGEPGRPGLPAAGPPLSVQTARAQVRRWEEAGWARRQFVLGQMWVVPTIAGLRLAGLRDGARTLSVWQPVVTQLAHTHAVALVRLQLEARMEPGQTWICERYLRRENAQTRRHVYDGAVELAVEMRVPFRNAVGEWTERITKPRAAIEVELTLKTPARYRELVTQHVGREWTRIHYYAPAGIVSSLRRHLGEKICDCPVIVEALSELTHE